MLDGDQRNRPPPTATGGAMFGDELHAKERTIGYDSCRGSFTLGSRRPACGQLGGRIAGRWTSTTSFRGLHGDGRKTSKSGEDSRYLRGKEP